jgi:hypothetical protein
VLVSKVRKNNPKGTQDEEFYCILQMVKGTLSDLYPCVLQALMTGTPSCRWPKSLRVGVVESVNLPPHFDDEGYKKPRKALSHSIRIQGTEVLWSKDHNPHMSFSQSTASIIVALDHAANLSLFRPALENSTLTPGILSHRVHDYT